MQRADGDETSESELRRAGRAISGGDPLRALSLVGRIETPLALTIRGIAYAQMGELDLAKTSLERAIKVARAHDDAHSAARAQAALVEIMLDTGDDPAAAARLANASANTLTKLGDLRNAAMQRLILARAEILRGRLGEARHVVSSVLTATPAPPADVVPVAHLARAEIEIRSLSTRAARTSLSLARQALGSAPHRLLARALVALEEELSRPIARLWMNGATRDADLYAIEDASRGDHLLVDACRLLVLGGRVTVPLARRPVLFALLATLARAWPASVPRDELAARAFDIKSARSVNASHRARLRVEIGRLRKLLADGLDAAPTATADGYVLTSAKRDVIVLMPPSEDDEARLCLLLGDGAAWSAKSLAEHAGVSQRTVQRALAALVAKGAAQRIGHGKMLRYVRPGTPIASRMLLLGLLPRT